MNKNTKEIIFQTLLVCCLAIILICGCRSFRTYPLEETKGSETPIISDKDITLPYEEMVFRKISPVKYGKNQPDYFLLETELTNEMYSNYLLATGRTKGDYAVYDAHIKELIHGAKANLKHDEFGKYGHTGYLDASSGADINRMTLWDGQWPHHYSLPVTLITVHDAECFCSWLTSKYPELGTFRLPTVDEWFIAAYGNDRKYPWGNEWKDSAFRHTHRPLPSGTDTIENIEVPHFTETSPEPVKYRPEGRTPEGLYAMWGNVSEMVIHPSNVVSVTFTFVGTRWMGGSYRDSNSGDDSSNPEWTTFRPRNDYWGFTHGTNTREQWLGFRVLLDPNDKEHKYQPQAPYNYGASW